MIKKLLVLFLFFLGCLTTSAQNISGKIKNNITSEPIINVAVVTNNNIGTTSDAYGNYNLQLLNVKSITFSSLGYKTITLKVEELKQLDFVVYLQEKIDELDEFELNLAKISLDSILIKATKSMQENYISDAVQQDFYVVEHQKMEFQNLELDLKSSSLLSRKKRKLAQNEFEQLSTRLSTTNPEFTREFFGTIASKKVASEKVATKVAITQVDSVFGYKHHKIGEDLNLDNVQTNLQNIVLKHLDTNKTYKIKTGLFKIEDSLSFKKVARTADSLKNDNSYNQYWLGNYKNDADKNGLFINKKEHENFFNQKYYEHQLETNQLLGNRKFYVVSFQPRKSKAKFTGKIYIDPTDFTIKKIHYKFAEGKRGEHLNLKFLLGIKYAENGNSAVIFFEKDKNGKVYASYFKSDEKNYAYVNRPIKFIENSRDREKVKFNIKIEVIVSLKTEVLLQNPKNVLKESVVAVHADTIKKKNNYITKEAYATASWQNKKLIAAYLKKYD